MREEALQCSKFYKHTHTHMYLWVKTTCTINLIDEARICWRKPFSILENCQASLFCHQRAVKSVKKSLVDICISFSFFTVNSPTQLVVVTNMCLYDKDYSSFSML